MPDWFSPAHRYRLGTVLYDWSFRIPVHFCCCWCLIYGFPVFSLKDLRFKPLWNFLIILNRILRSALENCKPNMFCHCLVPCLLTQKSIGRCFRLMLHEHVQWLQTFLLVFLSFLFETCSVFPRVVRHIWPWTQPNDCLETHHSRTQSTSPVLQIIMSSTSCFLRSMKDGSLILFRSRILPPLSDICFPQLTWWKLASKPKSKSSLSFLALCTRSLTSGTDDSCLES